MLKNIKFPTAHTVLLLIAFVVALLTWIIPSGQFDRLSYDTYNKVFTVSHLNNNTTYSASQKTLDDLGLDIPLSKFVEGDISKPISIPNTYTELDAQPQGIAELIQAPLKGILQTSDIILLVLVIGGLIGIVNATGAFEAGISWLARALKDREYLLIVMVTTLIALGGTTFGLEEETIAFYPILIPVFLAAKYDAMVGLGSIYIGSCIGTMISTVNPFSTIIASDAAGINWTVGLDGRIIVLLIGLIICIAYLIRYAHRVKKDPSKSIVFAQKAEIEGLFALGSPDVVKPLTLWLRLVLTVFSLCFVVMVYGVSQRGWWFLEMTSVFFAGALIIGLLARMSERDFVEKFIRGSNDLLGVAFIIGIARGVTVLMEDGLISDTLLYYASNVTQGMHKGLFVNALLYIYSGLTFFIPSSSGMAVLTMPIMSPLAEGVGIGREVIVNTYLFGVGLFKFINPTGIILASLAIVKIGYDKWLKFIMPLVVLMALMAMTALTISVYF